MECPRCGSDNVFDGECYQCGIIVKKYLAKAGNPQEPAAEAEAENTEFFSRAAHLWQELLDFLQAMEEKAGIDVRDLSARAVKAVTKWAGEVADRLLTLAVYFAAACLGGMILLFTADVLWTIYLETHVGQGFMTNYPDRYRFIDNLLGLEAWQLSFDLCLISLKSCLLTAAAARMLFAARILYEGRGLLVKYVFWPACCVLAGAWLLENQYNRGFWQQVWLTSLPAVILAAPSFEVMRFAVPELNAAAVYKKIRPGLRLYWEKAVTYFRHRQ